jgi:hypothetical protein
MSLAERRADDLLAERLSRERAEARAEANAYRAERRSRADW